MSIPRRVFSIWLNDNPEIPNLVRKCQESLSKTGYEIKFITLENCDRTSKYVRDALEAKKWVKAADYLRIYYLYKEGGVYLDSDMEVLKSFDPLLENDFFVCKEENGFIANSVIGSVKHHPVLEACLYRMDKLDGSDDKVFEYGMEIFTQEAFASKEPVRILSSDYFFPFNHQTKVTKVTENTVAYHHFLKSWIKPELPWGWFDENNQKVYREMVEKIPDGGVMAELGVCCGRSLCSVADIIKRKNIKVFAVDTFEGTANEGDAHLSAKIDDWQAFFVDALNKFDIRDNVVILRERTDEAYKKFADGFLDLVMIDADHSAEAVASDIRLWKPKLKQGGILCGDDWAWPSVREGIARAGLQPVDDGNFWFVLPTEHSEKPLFSICLIAKNEAKTLPRAIASLKEFQARGGSVVVVDTGSTDGTAQIARDAGCIVEEVGDRFKIKLDGKTVSEINARFVVSGEEPVLKIGDTLFDFSSARNYCASLSPTPVVSYMDCDEVFTNLSIDLLNQWVQRGIDQYEYLFVFNHLPDGSPGIQLLQSKMYNRDKIEWRHPIHELLEPKNPMFTRKKYFGQDVFLLEHFQNLETDRSGYLRGLAYDCFMRPLEDRQSHYFARELFWSGRPKSAIREFERHIAFNAWQPERSQSYVFIGQAYEALGENEKAVEAFHKAIQIDCSRREPFIRLSELYYRNNDYQRTACYAEAALTISQSGFYADDSYYYRDLPHSYLYLAYFHLGKKELAKEHFLKAFAFAPSNPKYLFESQNFVTFPKVSILIPSLGRPEGLKKCLDSIEALDYPKDKIEVIIEAEEEPTVPQKVAKGLAKSKGEYVVYAANDVEFTPDSLKIAILSSMANKKGLVAFHSEELLPDLGNICCHFLIKRDLIPRIGGEIFCTRITHCSSDNLLWYKCNKLGEAHHEAAAKIAHNHFSKGADFDWIYARGWSKVEEDKVIFKEEVAKFDEMYVSLQKERL